MVDRPQPMEAVSERFGHLRPGQRLGPGGKKHHSVRGVHDRVPDAPKRGQPCCRKMEHPAGWIVLRPRCWWVCYGTRRRRLESRASRQIRGIGIISHGRPSSSRLLWLGRARGDHPSCPPGIFSVRRIYGEVNIRLTEKEGPPSNGDRPDAQLPLAV